MHKEIILLHQYSCQDPNCDHKGRCQKRFSGFCPLRGGTPPPTPLTDNHFAKKPLAERGVPPPLNGQSPKFFLKNMGPKGLKLALFGQK